jgi:dolichol-phosphate mannosyltransferase
VISTSDAFAAAQGLLGARVALRMLLTSAGDALQVVPLPPPGAGGVSAIVPVLDERRRLGACLDGLCAQGSWLTEILVVDGGSSDGTQELVASYAAADPRVRSLDASPVPVDWNGKAWGLERGLQASRPESEWIVTLDADVRPGPDLVASLLEHARRSGLHGFSAAPGQRLSGAAEALVHPSMLATLVYRYGLPGAATSDERRVQADGQCFMARRALLLENDAFAQARSSRCEDFTVARVLARAGVEIGFFEAGKLATVEMYASLRECWENWPRSLPVRDASTRPLDLILGLAEIGFVQALPPALVALCIARGDRSSALFRTNLALCAMRFGVLAGTRRAYLDVAPSYWLSAFADLPVAARIVASAFARGGVWRGRELVPERAA